MLLFLLQEKEVDISIKAKERKHLTKCYRWGVLLIVVTTGGFMKLFVLDVVQCVLDGVVVFLKQLKKK